MTVSIPSDILEKFTTFGDLLRFLRRRVGLTQTDLARTVGFSHTQISRLEQNLRLPDIPAIQSRFISALGLEEEPKAAARLLDLASHVRRENAPALGLCPYKGLNYFDEADADLFVGREELTSGLVERVLSLASKGSRNMTRFLVIVGASGSGKSSLVRAGLIAALRWNEASTDWHIHLLTPTDHPLESLAEALTHDMDSVPTIATLTDNLLRDPHTLQSFAKERLFPKGDGRLLLVIDQFEEVFALCHYEEERASFIENLLTASSAPDGPVMVVITLRADFYAPCANYPQLREALAKTQEYIGAMNDDEIRRAIAEPAQRGRWELEPGLVDLLLHDVGHEPGALPLLSHALFETWQRRRGRMMTLSGYASSGGVRGAIAETAETVFADQLTNKQRAIARKIFLRLTELADEASTADTRRRAAFTELILNPEEAHTTYEVLKALADARLITTSEDAAEVAHEALIREWPTLRGWLAENRESLRLHRQITEAAQEWRELDQTPDLLYRGARLAQAREWIAAHQDEINELERDFLTASIAASEREAAEREEGRQRELTSAKELAETQRQSASRLRARNRVITAVGFIAVILAMLAGIFGLQSRNEKRLAISRELSSAAVNNLEVDPELSILLALQALNTVYSREAEDALHRAIQSSRVRMTLTGHSGGAHSVDYSPDGETIAVTGENWEVIIWVIESGEELFRVPGSFARYSPDGARLAIGGMDGTVTIWDFYTRKKLLTMKGHNERIVDLEFSPDGQLLASAGGDNRVIVWDAETGGEEIFSSHAQIFGFDFGQEFSHDRLTFSADSKRLVALHTGLFASENKLLFWEVDRDWALTERDSQELMIFSPDGRWLISWDSSAEGPAGLTNTKGMALWDISNITSESLDLWTLKPFVVSDAHDFSIVDFDFSQDGSMLASISEEGVAKVWHLSSTGPELLITLSGHTKALTDVAFSSDGTRLATTSVDGTVRLWDITPAGGSEWFAIAGHQDDIHHLALTADGKYLITASLDRTAKVWELSSGKELLAIHDPEGGIYGVAISPDGKLLATAGYDNSVKIWELHLTPSAAISELPQKMGGNFARIPPQGVPDETISIVFSPDGTNLAAGWWAGIAKIWNVEDGQELFHIQSYLTMPGITRLAFSPDGRLLATAGVESNLDVVAKIWDVASGRKISTFSGHDPRYTVESIVFSPDSEHVATASGDGLKIWDAKTGKESLEMVGHTIPVVGVDFSPDRKYLATSSLDGTVRKWDATTGEELVVYRNPGGPLFDVKITPDGKKIIVSGAGYLIGYIFDLDETISLARSRLTRWFTLEECRKYLHLEECPLP